MIGSLQELIKQGHKIEYCSKALPQQLQALDDLFDASALTLSDIVSEPIQDHTYFKMVYALNMVLDDFVRQRIISDYYVNLHQQTFSGFVAVQVGLDYFKMDIVTPQAQQLYEREQARMRWRCRC